MTAVAGPGYDGAVDRSKKKEPVANDPRVQPAYTLAEAARYLRLPPATLRSWVVGRPYPTATGVRTFPPLLKPAQKSPAVLSFANLVEAHVLRALRTEHGVSVSDLRAALQYAEGELGIENLLLCKDLATEAGRLFLDRYGELIELSKSGQLAMRRVFQEHLRRVEWDERELPARLYPFLSLDSVAEARPITIDPRVAFGRPVVERVGISTRAIAERLDAGEALGDIAADYDLTEAEIEQAVLYERAA